MEEITTMAPQPPERPVWETFSRAETEDIVKSNIRTAEQKMAEITDQFCTAGYYLRRQLREEMWREAGAENFGQYVQDTYGKSRGWATRMMQINERYSQGGNDPRLDDKYKAYTVSQLQEMLYLPDGGEDNVTPDMSVREIRALRQPAADPDPGEGQQALDPELEQETPEEEWYRLAKEPRTEESRCRMNELARMMNWQGDVCDVAKREGAAAADWKGSQGQQVEVVDLADFCDVAKPDANIPECTQCQETCGEPGDIEVADEFPQDDLPEKWSMDLQAFVADDQDDGQEGSRDEGEGAAEDSGAAGGSQKHMRQYIESQLRYNAFEVRLLREDCQKYLDEIVGYQLDLLSKDAKALIPWPTLRKRRIMVDAYRMLEEAFRIREAKDED